MSTGEQNSYRRQKIAQALRGYREERGLTQQAAARVVERSPASISAYENGHRAIRPRDLRQILDYYGVTDEEERTRLLALAALGRKDAWWNDFTDKQCAYIIDLASLEGEAFRLRTLETIVVPGLLQTEAYMRAVMSAYEVHSEEGVALRLGRQRILGQSTLRGTWVLVEGLLRTQVGGGDVMRAQLRKLLEVTAPERFDLRVLPHSVGAHPGMDGPFTILDIGEHNPMKVVAVDALTRSWFIDDQESVERYESVHDELLSLSLTKEHSRALIDELLSGA